MYEFDAELGISQNSGQKENDYKISDGKVYPTSITSDCLNLAFTTLTALLWS